MNGLHLIGDLTGCRCDPQLLLEGEKFRAKCVGLVEASGLTAVGVSFHQFEGSGFTGCLVLAESHLAVHTWPERQGLTLDVYVCNYSADNSAKARTLFDSIVAYFKPTEVARHEIDRGEHLLTEPLNASTGFYIKASRQIGEWQTRFQKMQIYDTPHYGKLFRLDGFNMTSEKEEFVYHENLVHPALTAHAAPKRVLIIGGGDGGSSEEALKHPSVERVTMVEIGAEVIGVAKQHFHAVHNGVFVNPRLRVRVYIMYVPLYGSLWSMAVCSDKLDPKAFTADEIDRRIDARKLQELKYYNGETHEGVFALPNYVRDLVTPARLKQPARGRRLGVVSAAAK